MRTPKQIFADTSLWKRLTSDVELDELAKELRLPHWRGAVSRDTMSGPVRKRETWILNIEHSTAGSGTHWVLLVRDGDMAYYSDSYGSPPVKEVAERYPDVQIVSSSFINQPIDNPAVVYCGPYALWIAHQYWRTGDFYATVLAFNHIYTSYS